MQGHNQLDSLSSTMTSVGIQDTVERKQENVLPLHLSEETQQTSQNIHQQLFQH